MAELTQIANISALAATVQSLSTEVTKLKGNTNISGLLSPLTNIQANPKSESCIISMATT